MLLRFSRLRWLWWLVLIFAVGMLVLIGVSSVVADTANETASALWLREQLIGSPLLALMEEVGVYSRNDGVSAISIGVLSSLIPLSYIYLFRIPAIRRTVIQVITSGYYENFLASVIEKIYASGADIERSVLIILPSYELVSNKKLYWGKYRAVLQRHGFQLVQETTDDDFGRNIFLIQKLENPPLPVFVDMPTTLSNLKKIIELEDNSPAGEVTARRWHKQRFLELRNQFREELEGYVAESDWGNIRFIEGDTLAEFEGALEDVINDYDQG